MGDRGDRNRKRGPYQKWKIQGSVQVDNTRSPAKIPKTPVENIEEDNTIAVTDENVISVVSEKETNDENAQTTKLKEQYQPPCNDENYSIEDEIFNDLQEVVKQGLYGDLVDDLAESMEVFSEAVTQVSFDETVKAENENKSFQEDWEPIFSGSAINLGVIILLLCTFTIKFRLSDEALQGLMSLLNLILPKDSKLPGSMHSFQNYLRKYHVLPEIMYYCSNCFTHVKKDGETCPNDYCRKNLKNPNALAYFVLHSLSGQLQNMFQRKDFTEAIRNHRFKHYENNVSEDLKDVYDGANYKKLFNEGFLDNPNNISFALNTDGVQIFKSSKVSMWPVYALINELPISSRKGRENTLFYGFWISAKKPVMWSFLKPLHEQLSMLEKGITMSDYKGESFICKGTLMTVTCDLPAKCLVSNSIQFNGKFSCWYCLQEGQSFFTEKGGTCHVFPYKDEDPSGPPRTIESVEKDVNQAVLNIQNGVKSYAVHGIKGPFWFMFLNYFNIIDGFIIDYMHGVCSGIMNLLLKLWFSKDHKQRLYSYYSQRNRVNDILLSIKPAITVTRIPRSLDDLVHWKASEFRNFLLYWGIPILKDILSKEHFVHFCLLVKGVFLLSKEKISKEEIRIAERCMFLFVKNFENLYSLQFCTMNIHQLLHITKNVERNGPLFSNNCFVFEDINGYIVQHIHGTQGIDTQIVNTVNMIQTIPILYEKYIVDKESDASNFYNNMTNSSKNNWMEIENGIWCIGVITYKLLSPEECLVTRRIFTIINPKTRCFQKVFIKDGSFYIYSAGYSRMVRRNQSIVKYSYDNNASCRFGSVQFFIQFEDMYSKTRNVAVLKNFRIAAFCKDDSVHTVTDQNELLAVSVTDITASCMLVEANGKSFVCEFPNRFDTD